MSLLLLLLLSEKNKLFAVETFVLIQNFWRKIPKKRFYVPVVVVVVAAVEMVISMCFVL